MMECMDRDSGGYVNDLWILKKMWIMSWVAVKLLAYQRCTCSVELV